MGFLKGNKISCGRPNGAKNKKKPAGRIYKIYCKELNFMGNYEEFLYFCWKNPTKFYVMLTKCCNVVVSGGDLAQAEFDFVAEFLSQK
jgi:hypothetical protein